MRVDKKRMLQCKKYAVCAVNKESSAKLTVEIIDAESELQAIVEHSVFVNLISGKTFGYIKSVTKEISEAHEAGGRKLEDYLFNTHGIEFDIVVIQ